MKLEAQAVNVIISAMGTSLNQRLTWEILNQFGYCSAVGPSLERSGACAAFFSPELLEHAKANLHLKLTNEVDKNSAKSPPCKFVNSSWGCCIISGNGVVFCNQQLSNCLMHYRNGSFFHHSAADTVREFLWVKVDDPIPQRLQKLITPFECQ